MHKKFEISRTKITGGCQSGRKVVTHNCKSDLPLKKYIFFVLFRSPPRHYKKSKPLPPIINRDEIFSQAVTDSMMVDEYEEDSFVNDVIEYESSTADELDFVQEFTDKKVVKKVERKKSPQKTSLKKRKRIIVSSSEEDEVVEETAPSKLVETPPPPTATNSLMSKYLS